MLFFVFLIIIGIIIISNLRIKQIMQRCDDHINQICDNGEDIQHPEKIPVYISFLKKHSIRITKLIRTNSEFQKKLENFDYKLNFFVNEIIRKKRDSLYRQQLSTLLTHTIKDKDLKKQIITEIKNSKYIPKIDNNEEEHFTYNLLNHYSSSGGMGPYIKYPEIFNQINTVCLQFLKDNSYYMKNLISNLQKIGQRFTQLANSAKLGSADYYNDSIIRTLGSGGYLYRKTNNDILEYLVEKKLINTTTAEKYKSIFDGTYDKKKAEKEIETLKEIFGNDYSLETDTYNHIRYLYIKHIIEHGDIDDYLWLSDKLERILFLVDSPSSWTYAVLLKSDWLNKHKKMLDARTYGINPLLLFGPDDFKGECYYDINKIDKTTALRSVRTESVIELKQAIDSALSAYYPVPNFFNHAKEILDAYITGNSFCKQIRGPRMKSAGWYDDYNRKLCDIQLADLSPYEFFGFSTGYLENSLDFKKRIYIQYDYILRSIKDIAFKAYLKSMDDEIFDKAYEYCWEQIKNIEKQNS